MVVLLVVLVVLVAAAVALGTQVLHRVPDGTAGVVDDATGLIAGPALPPGWHVMPPGRRLIRVTLSDQTTHLEDLRVPTADDHDVRADLRVVFRVQDAVRAVREVDDAAYAVESLSETALRALASGLPVQRLLASNVETAAELREVIAEQVDPWGLEVHRVDLVLEPW